MEELNRAYLDALSGDIAGKKADLLQAQMAELHPADIAEILDKLEDGEVQYLWNLIQTEDRGDVLVELEEDVRVALLAKLSNREIAEEVLEHIDSDDAADVVSELPEERAAEVIQQLDPAVVISSVRNEFGSSFFCSSETLSGHFRGRERNRKETSNDHKCAPRLILEH